MERGVKAAIDISDGLISDLTHICKASQVGAQIEVDRVPVQASVKANFGDRALELALSGGEDYELLFTASAEIIDKVTVNIGMIYGGLKVNMIPGQCTIEGDIRLPVGLDKESVMAELERICSK